jgi:hypothetical protein
MRICRPPPWGFRALWAWFGTGGWLSTLTPEGSIPSRSTFVPERVAALPGTANSHDRSRGARHLYFTAIGVH